jgi:hypothetical protein
MAGACRLAMRCPVYRRRETDPGSGTELGNSAGDAKRKPYKCEPRRGKVSMRLQGADQPVGVKKRL